jgi:hypothetical protein
MRASAASPDAVHNQNILPGENVMSKRIGCVPAVSAALLASVMAFGAPARAADDCLAEPNREPPDGSHWYYRIDHANNRKCWHLGEVAAPRASPEPPAPAPSGSTGPVVDRPQQREALALSKVQRATLFQEFIRWNELQQNFR